MSIILRNLIKIWSCARWFDQFDSVSSYFKVDKYLGFRLGEKKIRNVFIGLSWENK